MTPEKQEILKQIKDIVSLGFIDFLMIGIFLYISKKLKDFFYAGTLSTRDKVVFTILQIVLIVVITVVSIQIFLLMILYR